MILFDPLYHDQIIKFLSEKKIEIVEILVHINVIRVKTSSTKASKISDIQGVLVVEEEREITI